MGVLTRADRGGVNVGSCSSSQKKKGQGKDGVKKYLECKAHGGVRLTFLQNLTK